MIILTRKVSSDWRFLHTTVARSRRAAEARFIAYWVDTFRQPSEFHDSLPPKAIYERMLRIQEEEQ
jgi:hypothetical protein